MDFAAFLLAGVAGVSWLQDVAFIVTIMAGLGSLSLVGMRWHDRIANGKAGE
jgi:hypothetical protein